MTQPRLALGDVGLLDNLAAGSGEPTAELHRFPLALDRRPREAVWLSGGQEGVRSG
jgi:hypothetical protein